MLRNHADLNSELWLPLTNRTWTFQRTHCDTCTSIFVT